MRHWPLFWPSHLVDDTPVENVIEKMVSRSHQTTQSWAAQQAAARAAMGPQSQRRGNIYSRLPVPQGQRRSGNQTMTGVVEFEPHIDCYVCRAVHNGQNKPHRAHHMLCPLNKTTKGKAKTQEKGQIQRLLDKAAKQHKKNNNRPMNGTEQLTPGNVSEEALGAFFSVRNNTTKQVKTTGKLTLESLATKKKPVERKVGKTCDSHIPTSARMSVENFKTEILHRTNMLVEASSIAPKTMRALASLIQDTCLRSKRSTTVLEAFFEGMEFCVPACSRNTCPLYDSFVGQKLYVVDWELFFPNQVLFCPTCGGNLQRTRTNFSKNKSLFPQFGINGPPSYAIVMHYKCSACGANHQGNESQFLAKLPPHMAMAYPVDPKYAVGNSHLKTDATRLMERLMVTHGNAILCAEYLYESINQCYMDKTMRFYSELLATDQASDQPYPKKDGEWLVSYPPQADTLRQIYEQGAYSDSVWWGVSDVDRHQREIQMVKCRLSFAQDHTWEVVKNYLSSCKAKVLWDVCTETGEIACLVLVQSTKLQEIAHAAEQLSRRIGFSPVIMYSDTWPHKDDFWELILGARLIGRLGLFHFLQRITKTLRQRHCDHGQALRDLKACIYEEHDEDFQKVIHALKTGLLGKEYTEEEICEMRATKVFAQRYNKYIRKRIRSAEVIKGKLDEFKVRYKVTASDGQPAARGRLDPKSGQTLFTPETHDALVNCKEKAQFLADPKPIEEMYCELPPNRNAKHGLPEFRAYRGESKLESFHDNLAHFGNCGMRESLADALNLCGTARYNRTIRHKLALLDMNPTERAQIPAGWESVAPFDNHLQLEFINKMARATGVSGPFANVEQIPEDNGERFLSTYLKQQMERDKTVPKHPLNDRCQCSLCQGNAKRLPHDSSIPPFASSASSSSVVVSASSPTMAEIYLNPYFPQRGRKQPKSTVQSEEISEEIDNSISCCGDVAPEQSVPVAKDANKRKAGNNTTTESNNPSKKQRIEQQTNATETGEMEATPGNATREVVSLPSLSRQQAQLHTATQQSNTQQTKQTTNHHAPPAQQCNRPPFFGLPVAMAKYSNLLPPPPLHPALYPCHPFGYPHRPSPRTQIQFCCVKHKEYYDSGKRGRPPHSKDCPKRNFRGFD